MPSPKFFIQSMLLSMLFLENTYKNIEHYKNS